jgi:DNA-binding response OmpR family regulator
MRCEISGQALTSEATDLPGRAEMKGKILAIDDDAEFRDLTRTWLEKTGYEVITAENGAEGLRRMYTSRPDLVLVDANMPEMDGWEVCRRIRDMCDTPVIMVTVNRQPAEILRGFGQGADDYVLKPVQFPELMVRIGAVLRRVQRGSGEEEAGTFCNGALEVDWRSHQVYVDGEPVKLTPTEFRLLSCLIKNRGWIVTHDQLLDKAWGPNHIGSRSFVKLYIRYLRQKLERDPHSPKWILTERGIGYRFADENKLKETGGLNEHNSS